MGTRPQLSKYVGSGSSLFYTRGVLHCMSHDISFECVVCIQTFAFGWQVTQAFEEIEDGNNDALKCVLDQQKLQLRFVKLLHKWRQGFS